MICTHFLLKKILRILYKGLKDTNVNLTCQTLKRKSRGITFTVPLTLSILEHI